MDDLPIYPKFYHCRGGKSDRDWILLRMRAIPVDEQQRVADEYEKLYQCGKGRKAANIYLHEIASDYRDMTKVKAEVWGADKETGSTLDKQSKGVPKSERKTGLLDRMMRGENG